MITPSKKPSAGPSGERLAKLIVESATDFAIFTTDLGGVITSWNPGAEKLLGWSEAEALGQHACMIFTPADRARDACDGEMQGARETGRAEDERWHRRKDGSEFWASGLMMRFEVDATGEHIGYLKVLRDRTPQHQAEMRLRDSEALARALFESSADCVKILDLDGRLSSMNGPGLRLMEIDDFCEFEGREWTSLWPEALRPDMERALAAARAGGVGRFYGLGPTAKGTPKWWDVQVSPVLDGEGRPQMLLSVSRDVTGRARADEDGKRLTAVIEQSSDFISLATPDGRVFYVNEAGRRIVGLQDLEEVRSTNVIDYFATEDRAFVESVILPTQEREGRWIGEFPFRRFDTGEKVPMHYNQFVIRDEGGEVIGVAAVARDMTEEKRRADALRESEAKLRIERSLVDAVIRQAPVGISIAEAPSGRALALNDKAVELIGHGQRGDDARRYEQYGAVHADGRPYAVDDYPTIRALRGGEATEQEEMLYRRAGPDGPGTTRLAVSSAPVRDEAGTIVAAVTVLIDVEERRRAEERLRASEGRLAEERARLTALVENLPVGVGFLDRDGRMLLCNPAYRSLFPDEVMPSRLAEDDKRWVAWAADGGRLPRDAYPGARALQGEAVKGLEFLFRPGDGREIWTRVSGVPLHDAQGEVTAALVVIVDVDAEKRAQEALRQLNETLEIRVADALAERKVLADIVEGTPATVMALDVRYNILAANGAAFAAMEQIYGKPARVGDNLLGLLGDMPEHQAQVRRTWARALAGEHFVIVEEFGDENRERIAYEARFNALRDREGRLIGAAHTAFDVTDRVRAQAELQATQEQLRQAQKMEAVGQLTGGIAHDFNNLLTGVIGSLDMMQRRISQGRVADIDRYTTAAITSANRAAALTHRLLAFSRRQPLDPKPVNANRLVTGMEELLRRTIGEAVGLEIVTAGGLWLTLCDPHQLENAILNLAINARDAMPGGGKLTIETCNARLDSAYAAQSWDVRPGQYVCICVTDTGSGMTPDVVAKAFDPFFTTKPIGQGTGLGLSMIYGFARQSEGYAKIYSEVGQGTTFKLYLPRHYGEAERHEELGTGLTEAHRAEHGEVVLVVEDEAAVRGLVVEVLEELGYRAIEADDGLAGLKIVQSDARIDLLVTDVGLPGLNGRQLADVARQHRPDLKVLFMTGYAENAVIANGFLEPGMEMVTKPFSIEALAGRIREMTESG